MPKIQAILAIAATLLIGPLERAWAYRATGVHGFNEDDRSQFVDIWENNGGNITVKVSNGRPWVPMWVVMNVVYWSGNQVLARKDYHVFCKSPRPGGHGEENWFEFPPVGPSVTRIEVATHKERPWKRPSDDWVMPLGKIETDF
jgi:hypothetical protein